MAELRDNGFDTSELRNSNLRGVTYKGHKSETIQYTTTSKF
jgi:hypothetical protein